MAEEATEHVIRLGLSDDEKRAVVAAYVREHNIRHVVLFSPERLRLAYDASPHEHVEWAEVILYKFYYRIIQDVAADTLLVFNEMLRSPDRACLTYNCLRTFLHGTPHRIVFQRLPILNDHADAMVLIDLDTKSRWRRDAFRPEMLRELDVAGTDRTPSLHAIPVEVDAATRAAYAREKRALIDGIGLRDPHTIPRSLHLLGGTSKAAVAGGLALVGRNQRLRLPRLTTYRDVTDTTSRTVLEFCHAPIDFSDFLAVSGQTDVDVLVAELPVDRWYFDRYTAWAGRVRDAYAALLA